MKNKLAGAISSVILSCCLISPLTMVAQDHDHDHDDHRYFDKKHNDYHNWDAHEDKAYHMWWEQRHRPYVAFDTLNERDRASYWAWRHNHSDAILKIDIR